MDTSVMITLGFLVFAIVMFAWEKIPLSITAMVVAVGLHLSGVLSAKEAFAGFVIQTSYYLWACLLLVKLFLQQVSQ